jgi:putative phosphoesterase
MELAVISDVHGNRWALEAVLHDLSRRDPSQIVNLGDSLFGPLDPAGTARLLRGADLLSIRGNQDRAILEPGPVSERPATLRWVLDVLAPDDLRWLEGHRLQAELAQGQVFLCHGTPDQDDQYLAEVVTGSGVGLKAPLELERELASVPAEVILCGHSHVPRAVALPSGKMVVNPGSVGLPAYGADLPHPHAMEAGSPHARYAMLKRGRAGWSVEHVAIPYDWAAAAEAAQAQGRTDWAEWLRSGRVRA